MLHKFFHADVSMHIKKSNLISSIALSKEDQKSSHQREKASILAFFSPHLGDDKQL